MFTKSVSIGVLREFFSQRNGNGIVSHRLCEVESNFLGRRLVGVENGDLFKPVLDDQLLQNFSFCDVRGNDPEEIFVEVFIGEFFRQRGVGNDWHLHCVCSYATPTYWNQIVDAIEIDEIK